MVPIPLCSIGCTKHTIPSKTTVFNFSLPLPQASSTLVQCCVKHKQWERAEIGIAKENKKWRLNTQNMQKLATHSSYLAIDTHALHIKNYSATQQSR